MEKRRGTVSPKSETKYILHNFLGDPRGPAFANSHTCRQRRDVEFARASIACRRSWTGLNLSRTELWASGIRFGIGAK